MYKFLSNLNIAITFTFARIILTPIIIINIMQSNWGYSFILFLTASLTDIIDGFLARVLNQETQLGELLDPLADKILIISCYISLLFSSSKLNLLPLWFIYIIIIKELLLILGTLIIIAFKKNNIKINSTLLGKLNTLFQVAFIVLMLILNYLNKILNKDIFLYFLYFISILNIITALQYAFKIVVKKFKKPGALFYE